MATSTSQIGGNDGHVITTLPMAVTLLDDVVMYLQARLLPSPTIDVVAKVVDSGNHAEVNEMTGMVTTMPMVAIVMPMMGEEVTKLMLRTL